MEKSIETVAPSKRISKPQNLIEGAKTHYKNMQKSWWLFAKAIHSISASRAFEDAGYETFKDFCIEEFPSINLNTLYKFVSVIDYWEGEVQTRLAKDSNFQLPSYESLYSISTLDAPKKEIRKLSKEVMNSELSYAALRDRIKQLHGKLSQDKPASDEVDYSLDTIKTEVDLLIQILPKIEPTVGTRETSELAKSVVRLNGMLKRFAAKLLSLEM